MTSPIVVFRVETNRTAIAAPPRSSALTRSNLPPRVPTIKRWTSTQPLSGESLRAVENHLLAIRIELARGYEVPTTVGRPSHIRFVVNNPG